MSQFEQVELLIQALRKVLVDLDEVAAGAIDALSNYDDDVAVSGISFAPEPVLACCTPMPILIRMRFFASLVALLSKCM